MEIWIPFNGTEVFARVPDERFMESIGPPEANPIKLDETIDEAFESASTPSLEDPRNRSVGIAVRPCLQQEWLNHVLLRVIRNLNAKGFPEEKISVFLSQTLEETRSPLQVEPMELGRVMEHRPEKQPLTEGPSGIKFNTAFMESEVKIALSVFEPSYLCGYAAAPHAVYPGLADLESMASFVDKACELVDKSTESKVKEMSDFCLRISEELPLDLAINIVSDKKAVYGVSYGRGEDSFKKGLSMYQSLFHRSLVSRPRIVLASAGGSPYDDRLSGVCQTVLNVTQLLKEGDSVIVACECGGWVSDKQILGLMIDKETGGETEKPGDLAGRALTCILPELREKFDICLVSVIPSYYVRRGLKFRFSRTVNSALQTTMTRVKSGEIAVVEDGYHTSLKGTAQE